MFVHSAAVSDRSMCASAAAFLQDYDQEVRSMNAYVERVIDGIRLRNPNQPEFIQAAEEIFRPLGPVLDAHPEYEENFILERLV